MLPNRKGSSVLHQQQRQSPGQLAKSGCQNQGIFVFSLTVSVKNIRFLKYDMNRSFQGGYACAALGVILG
jgi:hypothetical protein